MFKKIINWLNKSWTNGACIKRCLTCLFLSVLYSVIWMFVIGVFKLPRKK